MNAFTKVAKPKHLGNVTANFIEDFVNARLKEGVAVATVNKELRHLKAALRWAQRRKILREAPDFAGLFVKDDLKKPVIIPEEDFVAIVQALKKPELVLVNRPAEWWRTFLYVAFYMGLRRGEALRLTWNSISFERLEARVLAQTSKGRKERVIPITAELAGVLKGWREVQGRTAPSDEVLPWPYDSYRPLYGDWHAIQNAAGIPDGQHYVPKNCRSACASALIAAGSSTVAVKDLLGHATVVTTENYYINAKPALRAAVDARKVVVVD